MSGPSAGLSILLAKLTRDEMDMLVAEVDAAREAGIAEGEAKGRRLERWDVLDYLRAEAARCGVAFHAGRSHQAGIVAVGLTARADAIESGDHVAAKEEG